jgi:hypothetical protein
VRGDSIATPVERRIALTSEETVVPGDGKGSTDTEETKRQ